MAGPTVLVMLTPQYFRSGARPAEELPPLDHSLIIMKDQTKQTTFCAKLRNARWSNRRASGPNRFVDRVSWRTPWVMYADQIPATQNASTATRDTMLPPPPSTTRGRGGPPPPRPLRAVTMARFGSVGAPPARGEGDRCRREEGGGACYRSGGATGEEKGSRASEG